MAFNPFPSLDRRAAVNRPSYKIWGRGRGSGLRRSGGRRKGLEEKRREEKRRGHLHGRTPHTNLQVAAAASAFKLWSTAQSKLAGPGSRPLFDTDVHSQIQIFGPTQSGGRASVCVCECLSVCVCVCEASKGPTPIHQARRRSVAWRKAGSLLTLPTTVGLA